MINIFFDIIDGQKEYYIADEVEYEKGFRKIVRLSGRHRNYKDVEKILKILKERESKK